MMKSSSAKAKKPELMNVSNHEGRTPILDIFDPSSLLSRTGGQSTPLELREKPYSSKERKRSERKHEGLSQPMEDGSDEEALMMKKMKALLRQILRKARKEADI